VYGDSAAELADSYAHLVIATDDSLIVRAGARGRIGISQVSLVDGSVQVLVDGPRCASPVGFVQGRPVFTTQLRRAPAELAVLDGGGERRLTNFASARPVEVTRMTVLSELGPLDIWFIAPAGSVAPLPTVLLIHAAPTSRMARRSTSTHTRCAPPGSACCSPTRAAAPGTATSSPTVRYPTGRTARLATYAPCWTRQSTPAWWTPPDWE